MQTLRTHHTARSSSAVAELLGPDELSGQILVATRADEQRVTNVITLALPSSGGPIEGHHRMPVTAMRSVCERVAVTSYPSRPRSVAK